MRSEKWWKKTENSIPKKQHFFWNEKFKGLIKMRNISVSLKWKWKKKPLASKRQIKHWMEVCVLRTWQDFASLNIRIMTRKKEVGKMWTLSYFVFFTLSKVKVSVIRAGAKSTRKMSDDELISISNAGYRCHGWFPEFSLKGCPLALYFWQLFKNLTYASFRDVTTTT